MDVVYCDKRFQQLITEGCEIMEFAQQKTLSAIEIKEIRQKLKLKQKEMAEFLNVSVKTVEHWESTGGSVGGAAASLLSILREYPWLLEEMSVPDRIFPLRLRYMYENRLCTVIDVDVRTRRVKIKNFVSDTVFRAFGNNEHPSYEEYENFLESRCFPRSRDKMKIMLKELNLPFYEPFLIIQKTGGKMAEDNFWIQIER